MHPLGLHDHRSVDPHYSGGSVAHDRGRQDQIFPSSLQPGRDSGRKGTWRDCQGAGGGQSPITWGFVWLCVRRYPGGVSLAAWNPLRPLWALGWTIVIVGAIAMFLVLTPWKDVAYHPLLIVHATMDILFMLTLRSAIVAQEISVTA